MVLTLIQNVFKSFGVVLVAVIFIQVQKSSSQRSSHIWTKHWASLKKQNAISLSGMLSFFFCVVEEDSFDWAWDLFVLPYQTQCNAHCHSLWFRTNTRSKCSSRVQAVGHHFPSRCFIIPSIRHFILSFIIPGKEQLHDVCPPSPLLWLVTR